MNEVTSNRELVQKKAELARLIEEESRLRAEIGSMGQTRTLQSPFSERMRLPEGSWWLILILLFVLKFQLDHYLFGKPEPGPFPGFGLLEGIVIVLASFAVFVVYRWRKKNSAGK